MPKILISSARIRRIIADAITPADVVDLLRCHGIRYSFTTEGGALHIRVPVRTGTVRIYCEGDPLRRYPAPAIYPAPVLHNDY